MGFAGLKKDDERANLIAYLRTLSDNPAPLPAHRRRCGGHSGRGCRPGRDGWWLLRRKVPLLPRPKPLRRKVRLATEAAPTEGAAPAATETAPAAQ